MGVETPAIPLDVTVIRILTKGFAGSVHTIKWQLLAMSCKRTQCSLPSIV